MENILSLLSPLSSLLSPQTHQNTGCVLCLCIYMSARELQYILNRKKHIHISINMEWRKSYLDLILVPSSLLFPLLYHCWLWHKVRTQPLRTVIGINSAARRFWVLAMIKDNDKKNILAVQTIRNAIMGSTLMATTSILLSCGLGAVISSTYSVKKPINDTIFGAHGEFMVSLKYVSLLLFFLFAFVCYSLSIRVVNQVNFLINIPSSAFGGEESPVTSEYICDLLEKGFLFNTVGNRIFYTALPMLLWIFGPVLVFLSSITMVPLMMILSVQCLCKADRVKQSFLLSFTSKVKHYFPCFSIKSMHLVDDEPPDVFYPISIRMQCHGLYSAVIILVSSTDTRR